jgi:hypothetical protein
MILAPGTRSKEPKLSMSGYDPVDYFTDGKPVQGKSEIEYLWHKLRWCFASQAHRDLFAKDPDHYAPRYDGSCAMGASVDDAAHKDTVDPQAWTILDGKLYLVHNQYWLQVWQEKAEEHIKQANKDWDVIKNLAGPEILGPLCRLASDNQSGIARRRPSSPSAVNSRVTRPAMSSARVISRRKSSRLARMSPHASKREVRPSKTSSLRSAMLESPPRSTNMPICDGAILARPRPTARSL